MVTPRGERGSALIWVLGFIVTLGIVISGTQLLARLAGRQIYARNSVSHAELAAASAVEALTDRVRAMVASRLGTLAPGDLLALNADATPLPHALVTSGATVQGDTIHTGVRIVDVRDGEVLPHDEKVLGAWTHQPRVSFDAIPDVGGSVAMRTIELEVYATAYGRREGRRMVTRRLAVSVIPPHQHALYMQGDAELVGIGPGAVVGGPVRVDGTAYFGAGNFPMTYVGGIEARDGISAASAHHVIAGTTYPGGSPPLASLSRTASELNPTAMLAPWQGRVRIRPAVGGSLGPGRMQSSSVAGTGECPDFDAACFARGGFRPGITLRRVITGHAAEYAYSCGEAYHEDSGYSCGTVARPPAIRYRPWPFAGAPLIAGRAYPDPSKPDSIWQGFFPDLRREGPCDATSIVGRPYPTFRCPTNAYGFELDLSLVPAIRGGMIAVRREAVPNSAGAQEIVLIRNAATLAGPLTLVSEVPVVIWGSFNVADPKPALISAPRITVMPEQTAAQLQASMYWDLVDGDGNARPEVAPVRAERDVTIFAVLRSGYCRTIGGAYFGGSWEGMPATYGDWRRSALRVAGAVEGYDQTAAGVAACTSYWAPMNGPQPGTVRSQPPHQRSLLFNRRLLHPAGQPPGSWRWENVGETAAVPGAPTRTRERQRRALGGTTVLRLLQDLRTIPPAGRGSPLRPTGNTDLSPSPEPPRPQPL